MKHFLGKIYRPNLTTYIRYIIEIAQEMNRRSFIGLSNTDIVKMCIEQCYKRLFPDVDAKFPERNRFVEMPF